VRSSCVAATRSTRGVTRRSRSCARSTLRGWPRSPSARARQINASSARPRNTATSVPVLGSALARVGALFGRSIAADARRASAVARSASSAKKERTDIERAERDLEAAKLRLVALEGDVAREIAVVQAHFEAADPHLDAIVIRPRKSDIQLEPLVLLRRPWLYGQDGEAEPAW
jgi:hypothetical protein